MKASEIIPLENLQQWTLFGQFPGKEFYFDQNRCTTRWLDVRELVASQDIDVTDAEGKLCNEEFIEALEKASKQANASLRWMVRPSENQQVYASL